MCTNPSTLAWTSQKLEKWLILATMWKEWFLPSSKPQTLHALKLVKIQTLRQEWKKNMFKLNKDKTTTSSKLQSIPLSNPAANACALTNIPSFINSWLDLKPHFDQIGKALFFNYVKKIIKRFNNLILDSKSF